MQKPVIVLVTAGKHESVYIAEVRLFTNSVDAKDYCEVTSTGRQKHWILAQIVEDGEEIDLCEPEEE